jgi:hypothetical protein
LDRKKQYVQSMLQVDPLGLASRWKPGGPFAGGNGNVAAGLASADKIWFRWIQDAGSDRSMRQSHYTNRSRTAKNANTPTRMITNETA